LFSPKITVHAFGSYATQQVSVHICKWCWFGTVECRHCAY
jgi:hypothetical protein